MKILILIFFFEIKESKITRGHNYTLVKKQSRLDVRKYSFSQRTINVWNNLSTDCVHALPCYLVPSSRGRLLVIPMTVSLQASRSLVSAHSSVSVQFVMALMSSSHRARGLPLFLAPPPIPNIIDFSKLCSLRMMCPKYDSCCFFICASSGLVGLISSITDLLVILAVHDILSSLLQHHNSKLSILLISAFLIVQDSQPYSTTGKTNAFTILHFVVIVISLSFHILFILALSLPLFLMPIVSKFLLYMNPSLQFWLRGRQNPVQFLCSPHLIQILQSLQ